MELIGLLKNKFGSISKAAEAIGISESNLRKHLKNPDMRFYGRTGERLSKALGISPNEIKIMGMTPDQREYWRGEINAAIDLLTERDGKLVEGDEIIDAIHVTRRPTRVYLVPLINEIQKERPGMIITPPTHHHRLTMERTNEGNNGRERILDDRLKDLRIEYRVKPQKKARIAKIHSQNPYLLLGDAYQNFVESILSIVHLDCKKYREVALTYHKENGKLTETRDIVDFLTLEEPALNRKTRRITLYEIKLGRQREKLLAQLRSQVEAARRNWGSQVQIQAQIISGNPLDTVSSFQFEKADGKKLEFNEDQVRKISREMQELQEKEEKLTSLENMVSEEDKTRGISVIPLPLLIKKGLQVVENRTDGLRKGNMRYNLTALQKTIKKNPEISAKIGIDVRKIEELAKNVGQSNKDILTQSMKSLGIASISLAINDINKILQSRALTLGQIRRYEENLYLLSHYLRSRRFRKLMKTSKLRKKSMMAEETPINQLEGLFNGIIYISHNYKGELEENFSEKTTRKILGIKSFFRRLTGRSPIDIDESVRGIYGMSQEEFWKKYLPNFKEILKNRRRTKIRYEEKGLYQDFSQGTRVFSRRDSETKHNWILEALFTIGVNPDDFNLSDTSQLEEVVGLLEKYRENSKEETSKILEIQRTRINELEAQIENLENVLDSKKYSRRSNTDLHRYLEILKDFGLETQLDSIPELRSTRRKDKLRKGLVYLAHVSSRTISKLPGVPDFLKESPLIQIVREQEQKKKLIKTSVKGRSGRLKPYIERVTRGIRANNVWNTYKEFTNPKTQITQEYLSDVEMRIKSYLESDEDKIMIDRARYAPPIDGVIFNDARLLKKARSIIRNHLFDETKLLERYTATRMLQTIEMARVIGQYDEKIGQQYLELAREELRIGYRKRSEKLVSHILERIKREYEEGKRDLKELEEQKTSTA
ncbi:MAG: helix-turn-helix transcriptional regulator [Nanoarchaeota archaeon]|nr:helix-turn-helix transcriptional regulator [Nanoarchaeota archaeon]